jgi:hypothetical protein
MTLRRSPRSLRLIIRICRHILPDGRHCQGAAVRGRACCRHHLEGQTRLHNMARARRRLVIPRLCVPRSLRDLALNQAELSRVLATQQLDPDVAGLMVWAHELTAAALRDENASRLPKPNAIYHVPLNYSFAGSYLQTPTESIENTAGTGEGVHYQTAVTAVGGPQLPAVGNCGFTNLQP